VKRVLPFSLLVVTVLISHLACGGGEQPAPSAPEASEPSASTPAPATPAPTAPADRSQMELLETTQAATQTAINIVGRVKNISGRQVSGVTVRADFMDEGGRSIRVEQGNLVTDPLAPDAVSEFRISTPYNANIKRFNVTFAELFGGPLTTRDSRQQ